MTAEKAPDLDVSYARIILLFLATFLTAHFVYEWATRRSRKLPPGPMGLPVFGYLPFLSKESYKDFQKLTEKYGNIIGLYMGNKFTVILNEYTVVKDIFSNSTSWDRETDTLNKLEPLGFASLNGPEWVEQRRFFSHASKELGFGKGPWEHIVIEGAQSFVKSMEKHGGAPVDISEAVQASVTCVIVNFLTGRKLDEVSDAKTIRVCQDYVQVALSHLGPASPVSIIPWAWHFLVVFRISGYHKVAKIISKFMGFIRHEIKQHKTVPEMRDAQDIINSYLHKMEKISSVEEPKHYFKEKNLVGMLNVMFLGGSDTILSSIKWLLRLMAVHQDIQRKVHEEIMEVLGKDGIARYEERDAFPYTFAVLMEAQRISSITPLSNTRKASRDFVYNGYEIPMGTAIIPNLWALHNDSNYWPEPDKFLPERFLANDGKTLQKSLPSFAPFSIGRRNCPGEPIAWIEILAYFTEIIRTFHVTMATGVKADFSQYPGLITHLKPQLMCFTKRLEEGKN